MIKTAIDYFNYIRINGISKALYNWSQKGFQPREQSTVLLLNSLMYKIDESVKAITSDEYLDKLEAAIFNLQEYFFADISSTLVGNFANDEIVKSPILSREDYDGFIDLYNKRKTIVLSEFWEAHSKELSILIESLDDKVYKKLKTVLIEVKASSAKANSFNNNKTLGDAVISVDTPKEYIILSLDKIYASTMPPLKKGVSLINKN